MTETLTTAPPFHVETFTDEERGILTPYFTNLDSPVFAIQGLPEVVKGALFARYSRSPKSVRRLFLDEFASQPDVDGALVGGASLDPSSFAEIVAKSAIPPV